MDKKIEPGYYVVAFIDVLGQQEILRNMKKLPNNTNSDEVESFKVLLSDTYGTVTGMRALFQKTFDALSNYKSKHDLTQLSKEAYEEYITLTSPPVKLHAFSDSITIYLPLKYDESCKLPVRGIYGILGAAGVVALCLLAAGHPLRGGIDAGIAFEIEDGEIYGPALARAYSLESNIAQYPRLIIGDELVSYLKLCASQDDEGGNVKKVENTFGVRSCKATFYCSLSIFD